VIGYPEIKEMENSGIIAVVATTPVEARDARLREWWAVHGVDYAGIERWAREQGIDDLRTARAIFGYLLGPDHMAAMLATAWDMGTMMGFRLAVEATTHA